MNPFSQKKVVLTFLACTEGYRSGSCLCLNFSLKHLAGFMQGLKNKPQFLQR